MVAEIVRRHGVVPQRLIARIKRHPELLDNLTEHQKVTDLAQTLRITIEPITPSNSPFSFALCSRGVSSN
jgi:hypothetical protein